MHLAKSLILFWKSCRRFCPNSKREPINVYEGDKRAAQFDITRYAGGIDLGIQPWMYGEARVGLQFAKFSASPRIGDVDLPILALCTLLMVMQTEGIMPGNSILEGHSDRLTLLTSEG